MPIVYGGLPHPVCKKSNPIYIRARAIHAEISVRFLVVKQPSRRNLGYGSDCHVPGSMWSVYVHVVWGGSKQRPE
ncbi:hypothetical protein JTE90_002841 [Oedothorax gibbosus]|uniref:Uncharacterized protein n=1 Tax=Oedothorax gibbosus TaxID=931172 RepID=A0AAV6UI91_9ARAC|nr:hypothetical protein JTE90_002841 [Oedothorax gibbosus]